MTARTELEKAMSRCKISRRRRFLHAQRAGRGVSGMLETRSQKLGQGQRAVYEQAKTPELQNTVMDDRRADPQRAKRA